MPGQFEVDALATTIQALRSGDREAAGKALDHLLLESDDPDAVAALITRELER